MSVDFWSGGVGGPQAKTKAGKKPAPSKRSDRKIINNATKKLTPGKAKAQTKVKVGGTRPKIKTGGQQKKVVATKGSGKGSQRGAGAGGGGRGGRGRGGGKKVYTVGSRRK